MPSKEYSVVLRALDPLFFVPVALLVIGVIRRPWEPGLVSDVHTSPRSSHLAGDCCDPKALRALNNWKQPDSPSTLHVLVPIFPLGKY